MSQFNPYDAPSAALPRGKFLGDQGMWREGKVLLMTKEAGFPDRCVKCNAPAEGSRLKRHLSWHPQLLYVMIVFPGLLFYIIVAMIVRKTATIHVPICRRHRANRKRDIAIGWLGSLGGIALTIGAFAGDSVMPGEAVAGLAITGVAVLLGSMIYGALRARVIVPKRIDKNLIWLDGVCLDFLHALPDTSDRANPAWIEPVESKTEDELEIIEDFPEV